MSIKTRLFVWLLAATLPIMVAGVVVVNEVESGLTLRATREVESLAELEIARIENALAELELDGRTLASDSLLLTALDPASGDLSPLNIPIIEFTSLLPQRRSTETSDIEEVMIIDRQGNERARSNGFSWMPYDADIAARAMDERRAIFGNAFVADAGDERVGLALPIEASDGSILGVMLLENRLFPILDLSLRLETTGETIEAMVVQRRPDGTAEPITLRRFDRGAAFRSTVEPGDATPSGQSLVAEQLQSLEADDYRGVGTVAAVQRIDATGWGVVVKIDQSEAYGLADVLARYILIACLVTVVGLALGWWTQVRPFGDRISVTAAATERIANGDYRSFIHDRSTDEIGDLARSIDRMAADLEQDVRDRREADEQLRHQAHHDNLTGLINRARATSIIDSFDAGDRYSLLFLDLDGFKEVNDTYGHSVGDEVLVAIASRLEHRLGPDTRLARWGGDEFLAVLRPGDEMKAFELAGQLAKCFDDPVTTSAGRHRIGSSIGGASSRPGVSSADILIEADAAMFKQKHRRTAFRKASPAALRLVGEALDEERVEVFFQPVVRTGLNGDVWLKGAEALVRIRSEDQTILAPDSFLPPLGESDLAKAIDTRVMQRALATVAGWIATDAVRDDFVIAVNLGAASMRDSEVVRRLGETITSVGLRPSNVVVEIPETVETVDPNTVRAFRDLGVTLAIDDVGCQYSNLERMIDIDADIAKLDRRWIPDMATAETSKSAVLRSLIDQCRTLGLSPVAEGVETEQQLQMLIDLGVDTFQGYYFGKPVSVLDFEEAWGHSHASGVRAPEQARRARGTKQPQS